MTSIFQKLQALQKISYCHYSKYPVACVLIDDNNQWFEGVNVENASYGLSICAERAAIVSAVTKGVTHFKEAHILCGVDQEGFGTPCGACRQVLVEFMRNEDAVIIWNAKGQQKKFLISDLLPGCFRGDYLEKNRG